MFAPTGRANSLIASSRDRPEGKPIAQVEAAPGSCSAQRRATSDINRFLSAPSAILLSKKAPLPRAFLLPIVMPGSLIAGVRLASGRLLAQVMALSRSCRAHEAARLLMSSFCRVPFTCSA